MKPTYLPDINFWLALSSANHIHFSTAREWYRSLGENEILCFCRQTQLSFLRLLTTKSVMGKATHSQREAWRVYERWRLDGAAGLLEEPPGIEVIFRASTEKDQASPKTWTDAYLAAFAEAAGLTLVTFDKALAGKTKGAVLLG